MTKNKLCFLSLFLSFLTLQAVVFAQEEANGRKTWTFYGVALDDQPNNNDFAAMSIPAIDEEEVLLYFECVNGELVSAIRGLNDVASKDISEIYLSVYADGLETVEIMPPEEPNEIRVSEDPENMHLWIDSAKKTENTTQVKYYSDVYAPVLSV